MGLTIHYKLHADKMTTDPLALLNAAREYAAKHIQPAKLSEVKHFTAADFERHYNDRDSEWRWAVIQAGAYVKIPGERYSSLSVNPSGGYLFRMWPGDGCEQANFGLLTFPAKVEYHGQMIPTRLPGLRWSSFCKTAHAKEFLKCHLSVVAMLDWFDDHGVKVTVSDEGDYWKKRDVNALAREHGEDVGMLAAIAGALKDGLGGNVIAPILERPDFEHLEMQGLQQHAGASLAVLNAIRSLKP